MKSITTHDMAVVAESASKPSTRRPSKGVEMDYVQIAALRIEAMTNTELAFMMVETYRMRGVNNEYRDNLMLGAAKRLTDAKS